MRKIKFSKLHGQGNDFIIIDATEMTINFSRDQIAKICHRNFGIGSDGLILVKKSKIADFKMDYYNQDGSIAEMCGNGIRCMGKFIYDNNLSKNKELDIETLAGIKKIFLNLDKNNNIKDIRVNMGFPDFRAESIPVNAALLGLDVEKLSSWKDKDEGKIKDEYKSKNVEGKLEAVLNYKLKIDSNIFYINCVSMGNPHCVIFIGEEQNLSSIPVSEWGPKIENHIIFPKKTNVEFVKVNGSSELSMRVWERGVGETLACGTGACAAAVCAIKLGKIISNKVRVNIQGGNLNIIWEDKKSNVYLEGRVEHVFDGELES